jgi:4-hydroxymandelate oxidase
VVDPSLNWADLDWLSARTSLPLIVKGVLDPSDARRAVNCGASAVVVSNHGGRQLDGAVAAVEALPGVVEAVAGRCQVLVDSGLRSGGDVLKALALGADGVLLGRPVLWGLAAQGKAGAVRVLRLFQEELEHAMALAGCPDLASAGRLRTGRSAAPAVSPVSGEEDLP